MDFAYPSDLVMFRRISWVSRM